MDDEVHEQVIADAAKRRMRKVRQGLERKQWNAVERRCGVLKRAGK